MPTLRCKFACLDSLPSLPIMLADLLQRLDINQNIATIVEKINQEPALTIRILRIANSPFYGMSREIGSLREAIILLGLNRVRDMVVAICFSKMLPVKHKHFDYTRFWRHSLAVAECARQLAGESGLSSDFAFTTGLLHDIGLVLMALLFPKEFEILIASADYPSIEQERPIFGFSHAEIGGYAIQYWNLPIAIQSAVDQHETAPASTAAKSLDIVIYAANFIVNHIDQPERIPAEKFKSLKGALAKLEISFEEAMAIANKGRHFGQQIITYI
jgi:HD-like signal output (HDOD) protein